MFAMKHIVRDRFRYGKINYMRVSVLYVALGVLVEHRYDQLKGRFLLLMVGVFWERFCCCFQFTLSLVTRVFRLFDCA